MDSRGSKVVYVMKEQVMIISQSCEEWGPHRQKLEELKQRLDCVKDEIEQLLKEGENEINWLGG